MTNAEISHHVGLSRDAFLQRALGSRYFLYALVVHLGILAMLGSWIIIKPILSPDPFKAVPGIFLEPARVPAPPRSLRPTSPEPTPSIGRESVPRTIIDALRLPSINPLVISVERPTANTFPIHAGLLAAPPGVGDERGFMPGSKPSGSDMDSIRSIGDFVGVWFPDGSRVGPQTGGRIPKAIFTCYLGKYADGDWNCNPTALENMLTQLVRWSKNRIQASVQPKALDLASDEIFKTHPPFIFLTGHRDFHFTEKEVENLRQYLLVGGAIWADNSMPGRHSRFDEAFRREMKRVLPDQDFEPLPKDHDVYHAHFQVKDVPQGMNGYQEPIEQIKIGGELVVIYTLNAYSDLWETALNEQDKIDTDRYLDEDTATTYFKWGPHWGNSLTGFLYRNVNEESITEADRLALNVVVHLLTRYQDKLLMLSKLSPER